MAYDLPIISNYFVCPTLKTSRSKWRRIVVNGVKTRYEMNKDGDVRNTETKKILDGFLDQTGYLRYLLTINGEKKYFSKHRLLACLFIPIPKKYIQDGYKQENLTVNHKDGVKTNFDLGNLEWVTSLENQLHALDNGLKGSGEDSSLATHTEKEIIKVCEMLQEGIHPKEISNVLDIDIQIIWQVAYRRSWKRISKDYEFPNFEERQHEYFEHNDEIVHKICRMLTETNLSFKEIAEECNVSKDVVLTINRGDRHKDIVSQYNLPRPKEPPIPESNIRCVCELIKEGSKTIAKISEVCGVSKSTVDRVKNGSRYSEISKEYGIVS